MGAALKLLLCEWCGQPAVRQNPTLCAECYFKFWSKSDRSLNPVQARVDGAVYSK